MKTIINKFNIFSLHFVRKGLLFGAICFSLLAIGNLTYAQDTTKVAKEKPKAVKYTFNGSFIIDNQTVMVPVAKTFEFSIQHRFGVFNNGYKDLFGLYAPANIRIGFNYTPINNLQVGFGFCKDRLQWDGNLKYAILRQAVSGFAQVSVTYYGNFSVDTRPKEGNFVSNMDRISYFHQLIVARKITNKFSVQVAPSLSYFNNVEGYKDTMGMVQPKMKNTHFALAFSGKYNITDGMAIMANYDQPLTEHTTNNPHPNLSLGVEFATTGHSFQLFVGNYDKIIPQANNFFNQNDYTKKQFVIGFNVTRRW